MDEKGERNKRFIYFFCFFATLLFWVDSAVRFICLSFVTGDVYFMANCDDSTSKAFL